MLYKDHCNHKKGAYLLTGDVERHNRRGDFYIYLDEIEHGKEVYFCFRYGSNPEDYESGPIRSLIHD